MGTGLAGCGGPSVHQTTTSSVIPIQVPASPGAIVVSRDNREAFVSYGPTNDHITIVDLVSHRVTKTLRMDGQVTDMALSPNGRSLYVTMTSDTNTNFAMEVVDTRTASASTLLSLGGNGQTVSVSPDGRHAYVTVSAGSATGESLATIDLARRSILSTMPIPYAPDISALTPNGRFLYITTGPYTTGPTSDRASFDGQLVVVDIMEHRVVATRDDGQDVACGLTIAPDGLEVLESFCSSEGTRVLPLPIRVYDTGTNALRATIPTQNGTTGLAFSDDGHTVYAATSEDTIDVINPRLNRVTGSISVPKQSSLQTLGPLTLSPDGNLLCVGTGLLPPYALLVVTRPRTPGR
jgi:DNA-binding beta-propeller fold protein YncE